MSDREDEVVAVVGGTDVVEDSLDTVPGTAGIDMVSGRWELNVFQLN